MVVKPQAWGTETRTRDKQGHPRPRAPSGGQTQRCTCGTSLRGVGLFRAPSPRGLNQWPHTVQATATSRGRTPLFSIPISGQWTWPWNNPTAVLKLPFFSRQPSKIE